MQQVRHRERRRTGDADRRPRPHARQPARRNPRRDRRWACATSCASPATARCWPRSRADAWTSTTWMPIQMIWILRRMRDEGHYLDGREIKFPPKFFLGAAASPFASDPKFQAIARAEEGQRGRAVLPDQPGLRRRAAWRSG
ncbi:MAG: hypothetical protein MZV64_35185 [Ignavibacteriales bacterium]|nr:hypothetical protein [Ignavibacteriales bacterium]